MKLRRPKEFQKWKPFWSCSTYPDCRRTRQIREDGKPELMDDEEEAWGYTEDEASA